MRKPSEARRLLSLLSLLLLDNARGGRPRVARDPAGLRSPASRGERVGAQGLFEAIPLSESELRLGQTQGERERFFQGRLPSPDELAARRQPSLLQERLPRGLATLARAHAYGAPLMQGSDFVETGVAQGGASILLMMVLEEHGASAARHWACDSCARIDLCVCARARACILTCILDTYVK